MKKFIAVVFVAASLFIASALYAQSIDGVVTGIKNGNAGQITDNAGESFSLTIMDKSNNYSKSEAQQAIKDFFSKNQVKGFEVKHKGNSPKGQYAIGTLSTSGGNFRVNIFMKKEGSKEVIKELRFQLIE
ncbi:MAG TPA: DUF4783 domain-containing protein [Niabella sp.]|nr:DUF4783 domain-containing protein [Niabella sp.]